MKKLFFFLTALQPLLVAAQKNYTKSLDRYMQAQAAVHQFSGSVLVAAKGKIIYQHAFGIADREWNIANTIDTKFWIGSLTKQFTAAAILQLEEQGKLNTTDKLSKYFPDYPKGDSITLHMLMNHTSGIKECSENPAYFELDPNSPIESLKDTLINTFKNLPFDFSPGTFWKYSNSGYILLGYIIESVSGETYRDYLYKNILQKAGMNHSDLLRQDSIIPYRAEGYSKTPTGWKKSLFIPVSVSFSAGGLFSTTTDLLNWNKALYSGKIISAASLAKMTQPNQGEFGAASGLFVDKFFDHRAIFHQGALPGFNTFMINYPRDGLLIIILTNRDTNLDFISKGLAAIVFDKKVTPTYKRSFIKIDPAILKRYAGKFASSQLPFPINIVEKNSKLYLDLGRDIELVPESETNFYVNEPDVEIQLAFKLNEQKEITQAYYIEGGVHYEIKHSEN